MHVELRVRTFVELCLNKSQYLNDDYLKELTRIHGCIEKLFNSSFDTLADVKGKDKIRRYNEVLKAGVIDTIKPSKYSNMWDSPRSATGCSITSVYPCVYGSLNDRNCVNISIQPAKKRHSSQAVILRVGLRTILLANVTLHGVSGNKVNERTRHVITRSHASGMKPCRYAHKNNWFWKACCSHFSYLASTVELCSCNTLYFFAFF